MSKEDYGLPPLLAAFRIFREIEAAKDAHRRLMATRATESPMLDQPPVLAAPRIIHVEQDDRRLDELARDAFCYVETGNWHAAEEEGVLLAIGCWKTVAGLTAGFFADHVRSSARGRGLHRAIIRSRCLHARERGHVRAAVCIQPGNLACLENYRRCGFHPRETIAGVTVAGCLTLARRLS